MINNWYIYKDGQQQGPLTWEKLTGMALAGEITPEDLVIGEGMSEWISGSKVEGLFPQPAFSPPPPPPPPGPTGYTPASAPSGAPAARKKTSGLKIAAIVGASVIGLIVILVIVAISAARSTLRSSEAYSQAMSILQTNSEAVQVLGEPIEAGKAVNGEISVSNGSGEAVLSIPVSGSLSKGQLEVEALKAGGQWQITSLLLFPESGEPLNLLLERDETADLTDEPADDPFGLGFTMDLPQGWIAEKTNSNSVLYMETGKTPNESNSLRVTVLLSEKAGGIYKDLDDMVEEILGVYERIDAEIQFTESDISAPGVFSEEQHPVVMIGAAYQGENNNRYSEFIMLIQRDNDLFYQIVVTTLESRMDEIEYIINNILGTMSFVD